MVCIPWEGRSHGISFQVGRKPPATKERATGPNTALCCTPAFSLKLSTSFLPPRPLPPEQQPLGAHWGALCMQDPHTSVSPFFAPEHEGHNPPLEPLTPLLPQLPGLEGILSTAGQPWATLQRSQPRAGGRAGEPLNDSTGGPMPCCREAGCPARFQGAEVNSLVPGWSWPPRQTAPAGAMPCAAQSLV